MNQLIPVKQENNEILVSGRDLHEFLEIGTQYTKWLDRMLEFGFEEGTDFYIKYLEKTTTQGNKSKYADHMFKLNAAKDICRKSRRNNFAAKLLQYLLSIDGKEVYIVEPRRKEIEFGIMLDKLTGLTWQKQYPIDGGKYRLDFKLGSALIVEYNEKYHEYSKKKEEDGERLMYCVDWLSKYEEDGYKIPIIIVKEGFEFEGLHEIILHLVGFGIIYDHNNRGVVSNIY